MAWMDETDAVFLQRLRVHYGTTVGDTEARTALRTRAVPLLEDRTEGVVAKLATLHAAADYEQLKSEAENLNPFSESG